MSGKRAGVLGCSYFTFYSLKTLLEGNTLLDAAVSDVSPFFSLPPVPETHMWPTALSFDVTAITSEGFLKCTCLGLQRRALEELRLGGVATFSCPQGVFGMCERADLLGPAWDLDHSSIEVQQKTLLSVALEHHMTSLLKSCAHVWMDGGCGTGFSVFVDWIRQKLEDGLKEKDRLCNRLFSGSAGPVDKSSSLLLAHLQSIFHHLSRLLTSILTPLTSSPLPPDDPVISELSGFYVTASNCHAITQVVIWCVRNGLLPVATVSYGCYFVYPASALSRLCDRMRTQICPCKLALDYLCDDLQCDYHYPPDKMEGLLSIFTTTNTLSQHCLMMYFLCDISNLDGVGFDQDTLLHSYSSQFNPTNPLTSLVRGLWALDHSHYQMALTNLIGRQLGPVQWLPWLHSGVLSLLLRAPDPCLALTYIDAYKDFLSGPEDLKLRLNVLVRCHCVSDAINLLKPYEDSEDIEEYFSHFLDLCFQHQCLSKLVNLPLNEFEDAYFCQYLEDSPSLKAQELLVMHHLAHHRYSNAIATQKKIRPLAMADPDPDTRERSQFRDSLLEGFNRCIPSVLQEADKVLAGEREVSSQFKPQAGAKNPPLSLVLAKNAATRTKSAADEIFQALQHIAQAREVSAEPYSPFRQKSDGAVPHTPFFSPPPSVRKAMSSRRKCPVVQATPISRPPTSGHVSIPDHPPSSGVSFLSTYMENFKLRMLQMSQTAATIDTSLIKTPSLKPMESESVNVSTTQPPPSILKVKQPSGGVRSDDVRSEGVRGDEEEEYKSTPAPITRKIRFAVEGTPLVSPVSSLLPQSQPPESVPAPDTTSAVSTAPTSIALETPLPSSDDSDLYYSFTEPSSSTPPLLTELTPAHPPQGTPSQSPLPKTQLFIGAIEDYEDEEQQQQDGKQDGKQDEPDSQMDTESGASVQSDSLQQSHDREHAMATEKKTVVTKDVSVAMATQKIRFHDARSLLGSGSKATPTKGVAGGLFAPSRPSPLSHSITSHSSPLVSTSTSVSKTQKSIFALEMANEMVGAKKDRLSLESMRRKAINQISSSPQSTQKDSAQQKTLGVAVSATMVQVPISDIPRQGPGGPGAYRFSPGKILSTPPVDQLKSPEPAFVFSPPLTRSAARRKAAASRMAQESGDAHHRDGGGERGGITGETECAGERERRRDEGRDMGGDAISAKLTFESAPPEPHSPAHGLSVSGGHDEGDSTSGGRHKQPMKTTRSHGSRTTVAGLHIELDRVNLVSPPSLQTTPTTTPRRGQRSRQQVTRPVRAMATRRSTRLLQDKKNF